MGLEVQGLGFRGLGLRGFRFWEFVIMGGLGCAGFKLRGSLGQA